MARSDGVVSFLNHLFARDKRLLSFSSHGESVQKLKYSVPHLERGGLADIPLLELKLGLSIYCSSGTCEYSNHLYPGRVRYQ